MCPDRQILSLYTDGELPSPWKEKLETHLTSCPDCVSRLGGYRRLSLTLGQAEDAVFRARLEAAESRVWGRVVETKRGLPPQARAGGIWTRRVSLPLPAAAAAAVILVIVLVIALRPSRTGLSLDSMAAAGIGLEAQGISPAADMRGVLQYLEEADGGDILIIRLPESKSFSASGEPALLKAADYTRSVQRRTEGPTGSGSRLPQ